jgi:rhodanese-related sulfurtransferase
MPYSGDLTPRQAYDLVREDPTAVLVDVRTAAEWSYVGVVDLSVLSRGTALVEWVSFPDGARNPAFLEQLRQAAPDQRAPVVFICRSGVRSIAAAEAATAAGYTVAFNVLDGFEGPPDPAGHRGTTGGWKAAGLPWRQR